MKKVTGYIKRVEVDLVNVTNFDGEYRAVKGEIRVTAQTRADTFSWLLPAGEEPPALGTRIAVTVADEEGA